MRFFMSKQFKNGKASYTCQTLLFEKKRMFLFYPLMFAIKMAAIFPGFTVILFGFLEKSN